MKHFEDFFLHSLPYISLLLQSLKEDPRVIPTVGSRWLAQLVIHIYLYVKEGGRLHQLFVAACLL